MPRVQIHRLLPGLWVAAEVNDYDEWVTHRFGLTAGQASARLTRSFA